MLSILLLLACEDKNTCGEENTASAEKIVAAKEVSTPTTSTNGLVLSEKEASLLKPTIDDLRIGVREWSSESVGICKKEGKGRDCKDYIGLNSDGLPEGNYMLRGEFQAPILAPEGGWKIKFSTECEIVKKSKNGESKSSKSYSKEYNVSHSASTENGYRLSPLKSITSPSARGEETCSWKIEANNLDGPKVWEGKYVVPAKE